MTERLSDFTFTFHFHALEKEMATHSSILAWRIPGTAEPAGLPSVGSQSRTRLKRLSSSGRNAIASIFIDNFPMTPAHIFVLLNSVLSVLLLLLLSRFSRVRLCATPETAAYQAPVPGILQARTLEWVAISFSNA